MTFFDIYSNLRFIGFGLLESWISTDYVV